jgi:hypothetical protein
MPRKEEPALASPLTSEQMEVVQADPSHTVYLLLCVCGLALAVAIMWLGVGWPLRLWLTLRWSELSQRLSWRSPWP